MLLIRCSACRAKLFKYEKIGKGEVLICHKDRLTRRYEVVVEGDRVLCPCGNPVAIDKGDHLKMIGKGFTASGTKTAG